MAWHLILNLKVVEAFSLVKRIGPSTAVVSKLDVPIDRVWRWLVFCAIIAAVSLVSNVIVVRVVDEALFLEKVAAARLSCLVYIPIIGEGVVLNVDLALVPLSSSFHVLLNHTD